MIVLIFCGVLLGGLELRPGTAGAEPVRDSVALRRIAILPEGALLANTVSSGAISDAAALLARGFPGAQVGFDGREAQVRILLRLSRAKPKTVRGAGERPGVGLRYPVHGYSWTSLRDRDAIVLRLESPSPEGIACGLYGLLQERLGFGFVHPKRTIFPAHDTWPLPATFRWDAMPRFEKKGFHVHTLHPIELTEPIHDPTLPGAFEEVKGYIDWLARNQQNLFQFFLLRTVDRSRWPGHADRIVRYAHRRGILAGVEVSLFMLQQNAFRLVHLPKFWHSYRRQADASLAWLFQAPWDFVTVDFTMGEYLPDLADAMPRLRDHVVDRVTKEYGAKLLYTTHVIPRAERRPAKGSASTGILIHTVMCYSLSEPSAQAYGNADFRWLLDRAKAEAARRETWYWPESSYWIAFDSPVPLLLLPYLDARLSDMATMERIGAAGHMTFTSGWEWGYWLVDWSIARWSWTHAVDGRIQPHEPLEYIGEIARGRDEREQWRRALALQNRYFKEKGLLPYLSALDPSAELPWPFDKPFQPRPPVTASRLLKKASEAEARQAMEGPVRLLEEYAGEMESIAGRMTEGSGGPGEARPDRDVLREELTRSLAVSALRARHKALILKASPARRGVPGGQSLAGDADRLLKAAAELREGARGIVRQQEDVYRYPPDRIARKRPGHTSYAFGYLFPASELHFWRREEEQVRRARFDAFFMNLWDFPAITGADSLFDSHHTTE